MKTIEDKYDWILRLAVRNGLHPHIVLREALANEMVSKEDDRKIREMLVERRSEHTFGAEAH